VWEGMRAEDGCNWGSDMGGEMVVLRGQGDQKVRGAGNGVQSMVVGKGNIEG